MTVDIFSSILADNQSLARYLRDLGLLHKIIYRQQQEQIALAVKPSDADVESRLNIFLAGRDIETVLSEQHLEKEDLLRRLQVDEACDRFARQRFAPGLEQRFLASLGSRDEVIYSLLRVRDAGLARELWIRLEEGETTFAEAAHQHSEGEEASRKGVIGPMPIGLLQPSVLQEILRGLRPGEISPPRELGEWHVLMRLERLRPAKFDETMRAQMLQDALNAFLEERVKRVLAGEADSLEPIHYDLES